MKSTVSSFLCNESGATAIEYGLIAAIVGVGIVASLQLMRDALVAKFGAVGTGLNSAN